MAPRRFCLFTWTVFAPSLPAANSFELGPAINRTGINLVRELVHDRPTGNLVVSPYSIQSALALAYAGSAGVTRDEIAASFSFPLDDGSAGRAFARLRNELAELAINAGKLAHRRQRSGPGVHAVIDGKRIELQDEPSNAIEWRDANRLFAQSGYAVRPSFLTLMREEYAAPFEPLDFLRESAKGRETINRWVNEQTYGRIPDLIPDGEVSGLTRLVLVNALYLKAPWDKPFERAFTKSEPFHLPDGSTRDVSMMRTGGYLSYAHEKGLAVVSLPYIGGELQFLVLLPDVDLSVDNAVGRLTPEDFARWSRLGQTTKPALVALHLPKFKVEGASLELGPLLRRLGMRTAFDEPGGSADFDRIAPRRRDDYLHLSKVFHQTMLSLDEEGTEAAAATAMMISFGSVADRTVPIEVRVDRPFLFAIQHRASGACLFFGRITVPR